MIGKASARSVAATILIGALAVPLVRIAMPVRTAPVAAPRTPPAAIAPVAQAPAPAAKVPVANPAPAPTRAAAPSPTPTPTHSPAPLVIRRVIDTGGPIKYGHYFWDDSATPPGPLTITIDLKASVLSVFRGGDEIGTTAVIYGADSRQTPLGTFPILQKDRHHVSNLYHAPMPYMLRLTNDGVSIHASDVAADYATHGCIGVPAGFARKLFAVAQRGDRVIITNKGLRADLALARR